MTPNEINVFNIVLLLAALVSHALTLWRESRKDRDYTARIAELTELNEYWNLRLTEMQVAEAFLKGDVQAAEADAAQHKRDAETWEALYNRLKEDVDNGTDNA
jgi:hypothetical protein